MSALQTTTAVTLTQSVAILLDHTIAPANLDSLEMEENVSVNHSNIRHFISFNIFINRDGLQCT